MTVRFTRPQLLDLYCQQRKSQRQIASAHGCSATKVRTTLRLFGIEIRTRGRGLHHPSGVEGVSWCRQTRKWKVTAHVEGKQKTIGRFGTLEEARKVKARL